LKDKNALGRPLRRQACSPCRNAVRRLSIVRLRGPGKLAALIDPAAGSNILQRRRRRTRSWRRRNCQSCHRPGVGRSGPFSLRIQAGGQKKTGATDIKKGLQADQHARGRRWKNPDPKAAAFGRRPAEIYFRKKGDPPPIAKLADWGTGECHRAIRNPSARQRNRKFAPGGSRSRRDNLACGTRARRFSTRFGPRAEQPTIPLCTACTG